MCVCAFSLKQETYPVEVEAEDEAEAARRPGGGGVGGRWGPPCEARALLVDAGARDTY